MPEVQREHLREVRLGLPPRRRRVLRLKLPTALQHLFRHRQNPLSHLFLWLSPQRNDLRPGLGVQRQQQLHRLRTGVRVRLGRGHLREVLRHQQLQAV